MNVQIFSSSEFLTRNGLWCPFGKSFSEIQRLM